MELCEVRIPTYKRPQLLERALNSLVNQDYRNWVALVMDDSPYQEGRSVAEKFRDERIQYTPNLKNLGCAGNINRAFTSKSLAGGMYACILEDDNWLMPTFLSENIASLKTHDVDLLLRNQEIWLQDKDISKATGRTTRGDWFTNRVYTPLELHAHLFYFEGISNGGLFWQTSLQSNLQVSNCVIDSGLQEYCRTLQIHENLYFEPKPLCYWSEMPSALSLRNAVDNRSFGRGVQTIKRNLLKKYGETIAREVIRIAERLDKQTDLEVSLLDSLFTKYEFRQLSLTQRVYQYLKSYAKFKLVQNPLHLYFSAHSDEPALPANPQMI
ncbi:glycosyltransferase family 2 protein [Oculatella sp. LEGE 06141]|uniref:glycosyltransferase family 2 protein n=1 Tax=Oculatella sp. LEGE 06141 TaxID=1828648 RepID=UPI00187F5592|nr:glycosyltransferase family A protein [Oculatella sp. LEGE 06141]MBE9179520.1 glycosyltransferase family 2 protein [Oculatella sp. LEGE 06141]